MFICSSFKSGGCKREEREREAKKYYSFNYNM